MFAELMFAKPDDLLSQALVEPESEEEAANVPVFSDQHKGFGAAPVNVEKF
jgi:hypothetical protein